MVDLEFVVYLPFLGKRRVILYYSWVRHHVTSTLEYTTCSQKLIFIHIVPTL
jgi:hypothetical protein